jgi:hypothetical protein
MEGIEKSLNSRNQGFSKFFGLLMQDPDPYKIMTLPDGAHPDPDPQHCKIQKDN